MNTDIENSFLLALSSSEKSAAPEDRAGAWRQEVREFANREVAPLAAQTDAQQLLPSSVVQSLRDRGYLGFTVSPQFNGQGGDFIRYGILCEEIGKACSSTRSLLTVHDMVAYAIDRWGNSEQKNQWLPQLARGEKLGAFSISEESVGSHIAAVQTSATQVNGGFIVNGVKKWVTFGQLADLLLVMVRCDDKLTALLVDANAPGLTRRPISGMLGMRGAMLAELVFEDCFVPHENLLARIGFGASHVATSALQLGRYNVACGSVGIGQACIELCCRHTTERHQFGVPLKDHQLVQRALTDMLVEVRAARLVCNQAGYSLATAQPNALVQTFEAKYVASRVAMRAARQAVQLHGAAGCLDSSAVSRLFRDAKVMEIIEGTNEICQVALARHSNVLM